MSEVAQEWAGHAKEATQVFHMSGLRVDTTWLLYCLFPLFPTAWFLWAEEPSQEKAL